MNERLSSIAERVASRRPGSARTAGMEEAADLIQSGLPVVARLSKMVEDLEKDFDHADRTMTGLARAGAGRTEAEELLGTLLRRTKYVRKYVSQIVIQMEKALR